MDTSTFAQKIKAKYPAYQNVDDATLVKKFIEKYPEYKSQVNVQSETSQDISQTGKSIVNTVNQGVDKYSQIQARQDAGLQGGLRTKLQQLGVGAGTASGVINDVLTGAVKTVLPQSAENVVKSGIQTVTKPIVESAPVQSIMSKYEELKQTNPKLAQDISSALGFAQLGLDVTGIGETAGLVKTGIKKGVQLAETGVKDIAQAGSELATGVEKLGTAITPKPEEIMNRVARLTPSDATKFEALAGKSHGQYLKETGNFGTPDEIVKREAEKFVQSMNEADNALASLPGEYKSPSIDVAASELVDKAKRVSAPGIDSPILARATELQNKANTTGLTMSEVNELKRLYEKNVKLGYNKLMNADAVERATNIDNALRNWQFGKAKELGFSNLDELNKQTQLSKFMVDKLGNQILGKSGNNAMGLTDWIMVSGGDPTAIGGLLVKKFFSSEKVQSRIAKMLTKEAPSELKTATINKPINNIGSDITGTTRSKPSQQLLEGKQLKKALPTVSRKNGIMSSDLSTGVKKAYNNAKDTLKTLKDKNVRERGSISLEILPERKPKGNQGVSLAKNTTEDLIQQAKKYKSAEEFVKAQPKLYHGGSADIKDIQLGKSNFQKTFYMSENPDYAKSFGGNKSSLNEIMVDSKAKLVDLRKPSDDLVKQIEDIISSKPTGKTVRIQKPDGTFLEIPETKGGLSNPVHSSKDILNGIRQGKAYFAEMPEVKNALKKLGYDGMITQESKMGTNFGVWNKDILKTKSQLEEIWKKANKNVEIEPLIQEAKKYKSAEEFVKAQQTKSPTYAIGGGSGHTAPLRDDYNAPAFDLTKIYPKDVYDKGAQYYGSGYKELDTQAISILKKIKDNPDAEVTIYRAVPKGKGIKDFNKGDWVTLTKGYAKEHGESNLNGKYEILSKKVKADEIFTDANSLQEFGYDPRSLTKSQLEEIWKKANKK